MRVPSCCWNGGLERLRLEQLRWHVERALIVRLFFRINTFFGYSLRWLWHRE